MASPAQINANRLNAQRSTGPRTEAGKAASRFNALQHGLEARSLVIPGEDPAELEALALEYCAQFHPAGPLERFLVDSLIRADWDRRRYIRVEGRLLRPVAGEIDGKAMLRVFQRVAYAERLYFRSLKELLRAQKHRKAQEEAEGEALQDPAKPAYRAATVMERTTLPTAPEQIGFDPPIPPTSRADGPRRL